MLSLVIHKDVVADIGEIRKSDLKTAMRIVALIHEIQADQDLLDRLTQQGYGANGSADFDVSMWFGEQDRGRNLWRLKAWDLERQGIQYRVIYAFEPNLKRYKILAVVPRSFNYDENHPITQRIRDAYDGV